MNKKLIMLALVIAPTLAFTQSVSKKGRVMFPSGGGVICDLVGKFCADKEGISLALTTDTFGQKAGDTWSKRLDDPSFTSTNFVFSSGVMCDTNEKVCRVDRYSKTVEPRYIKILFKYVDQ